jgi:BirA family biotin operon repressor/biotin-[acetyl-CoA-carboxylase] ligase
LFDNIFIFKIKESLALNLQAVKDAPLIQLDIIDSTNNYAMRLIDADTAQPGLTIVAAEQTQGKGQRGRKWKGTPGESLLMSLILTPWCSLEQQFLFNASVAVAVAEVLQELYERWDVRIKWPNDIIINDKKAGGILIENVLRGNQWSFSIIGLGLNVHQKDFPSELPYATSLKEASGRDFNISYLVHLIKEKLIRRLYEQTLDKVLEEYNDNLYRKDCEQSFTSGSDEWKAIIKSAGSNGMLEVQLADGSILHYNHGSVNWKWG